jgi:hypothetical protein
MNNQNLQLGKEENFAQNPNPDLNASQNRFIQNPPLNFEMLANSLPPENPQRQGQPALSSIHDAHLASIQPLPLSHLQQAENSNTQSPSSGIVQVNPDNGAIQNPINGNAAISIPPQPTLAPAPLLTPTLSTQIHQQVSLVPPNPTPNPTPPILPSQKGLTTADIILQMKRDSDSAHIKQDKRSIFTSQDNQNKGTPRMQYLEYMHSVMSSVIQLDPDLPPRTNVKDDSVRLIQRHFPDTNPPSRPNPRRTSMRRCRVCYAKGIRKETKYCCNECPSQPGLCAAPCFRIWHTLLELPKKESSPEVILEQ